MKYLTLAEVYERLQSTSKRLDKTAIISEFLSKASPEEMQTAVLLLQGMIYPRSDEREIGVAAQMMLKAISVASGEPLAAVEKEFNAAGDLGLVAEKIVKKKTQKTLYQKELTVDKVFQNIRKLPEITGAGSVDRKIQLIAELLTSANPLEARFIVRTILQDLRIGVGEGSLRDAIAWAFFPGIAGINAEAETKGSSLKVSSLEEVKRHDLKKYDFLIPENEKLAREIYKSFVEKVQQAYDAVTDFGIVAEMAKKGLLDSETELVIGKPIKVMLSLKADSIEEAFERAGKPAQIEFKYDGFRLQCHRKDKQAWLYTRRLENVTSQFPEVVEIIKTNVKGNNFILDAEAVGYDPKTKRYLPFQHISQRIKRKYGIEKMAEELPVELNVFDLICYEGKSLIKKPFKERRALIEKIIRPVERKIVLANSIITDSESKAKEFFKKSVSMGNEGIMMKNLNAPYKPGARVGHMVKYKETMDTLDLVIVGAEWGTGKRATWLSSFVIACRKNAEFLEIGKVGTGIKEKEEEGVSFPQLTRMLKPHIISEKGNEVNVKPLVVVEVAFEEIQKSPSYSSGYALRFPRLVNLREDRAPEDCSTLKMVEGFYKQQRFGK